MKHRKGTPILVFRLEKYFDSGCFFHPWKCQHRFFYELRNKWKGALLGKKCKRLRRTWETMGLRNCLEEKRTENRQTPLKLETVERISSILRQVYGAVPPRNMERAFLPQTFLSFLLFFFTNTQGAQITKRDKLNHPFIHNNQNMFTCGATDTSAFNL